MNRWIKVGVAIFSLCIMTRFWIVAYAAEDTLFQHQTGRPKVILGFSAKSISDVDIRDARAAVNLYIQEIASDVGTTASGYIYDNTPIMLQKFKTREIDLISLKTLEYLRVKSQLNSELTYGGIKGEKKGCKYLMLVHADNSVSEIDQLLGSKLAVSDNDDLGMLFLNTLLLRKKQPEANGFFSSVIKKKKPSQAVLAVFFKRAAACVATDNVFETMVALNPQVGKTLKVLAASPKLIDVVAFIRKDYDAYLKKKVMETALAMHTTPRGRQIMLLFKLNKIVAIAESDLDTVKALVAEYNALKAGT